MLSESLFREGVEPTLEDGLACLESMRHTDLTAERDRLKNDIREAERRGDMKEALRLMAELGKSGRRQDGYSASLWSRWEAQYRISAESFRLAFAL